LYRIFLERSTSLIQRIKSYFLCLTSFSTLLTCLRDRAVSPADGIPIGLPDVRFITEIDIVPVLMKKLTELIFNVIDYPLILI
jgi:hypothetical protein